LTPYRCGLITEIDFFSTLLTRAFNVNLSSINRCIYLLEIICLEAIKPHQDINSPSNVTKGLRNMKVARQVKVVEFMNASNTINVVHADAFLKTTALEQRTDL